MFQMSFPLGDTTALPSCQANPEEFHDNGSQLLLNGSRVEAVHELSLRRSLFA